jgi:hypothetical protein
MSKYSNYYDQLQAAKSFPVDIKTTNAFQVAMALQKLVRKEKLPLVVTRTLNRITVNKKGE